MPTAPEPQLEAIEFIIDCVEKNGFQPSQAELAHHFKVTKKDIQIRLKELAQQGLIGTIKDRAIGLKNVGFRAFFKPDEENENA